MKTRLVLLITGLSGALAVALGALGAHGLEKHVSSGILTEQNLSSYKTAVLYHLVHTLALLAIAPLIEKTPSLRWSVYGFMLGILLFSGSVYLLSTAALFEMNISFLGPVTPLGGLLFITGWIWMGITIYRKQ